MTRPMVVVKVGGSLLDWPGLSHHLQVVLEARRTDRIILIAGGGRFADALRAIDIAQGVGETESHRLALRVLDLTATVLAALVPGTRVIEETAELPSTWAAGHLPILAPRRFLDQDDRSADPLPHLWSTTTDAIAARLAFRLGAGELVLLKSVDWPPGLEGDWTEAARRGLIDPEFPRAAREIPRVTFHNLRSSYRQSIQILTDKDHRPP